MLEWWFLGHCHLGPDFTSFLIFLSWFLHFTYFLITTVVISLIQVLSPLPFAPCRLRSILFKTSAFCISSGQISSVLSPPLWLKKKIVCCRFSGRTWQRSGPRSCCYCLPGLLLANATNDGPRLEWCSTAACLLLGWTLLLQCSTGRWAGDCFMAVVIVQDDAKQIVDLVLG